MARWANIVAGAVDYFVEYPDGVTPDPNPNKGLDLRIAPRVPRPVFDSATHILDPETPTYVVNPTDVTEVWNLRVKTQAELDADKAQIVDGEVARHETGRDRVIAEVLWDIAKAANTNNWSTFTVDDGLGGTKPVANKDDFIQYIREKAESLL